MDKVKECVNCGATISAEDTECPYCHYMQYDAAEAQYMDALESMNDSMGSLDRNTRKIARKDIVRSVLITLAAAAVFAGIGILSGIAHGMMPMRMSWIRHIRIKILHVFTR